MITLHSVKTFRLGNVLLRLWEVEQMIFGALSSNSSTAVEEGMTFRRTGSGAFVETAQVLEVMEDRMGIPHVRFRLHVSRGSVKPTVECRTLALETFSSRYKKAF